jgi:hypothetical protein
MCVRERVAVSVMFVVVVVVVLDILVVVAGVGVRMSLPVVRVLLAHVAPSLIEIEWLTMRRGGVA